MTSYPPSILTVEEFTLKAASAVREGKKLCVFFKAPWCKRCSPCWEAISRLENETNIIFGSVDTGDSTDLRDEFEITKLPTLMITGKDFVVHKLEACESHDAIAFIRHHCTPKLVLTEEF